MDEEPDKSQPHDDREHWWLHALDAVFLFGDAICMIVGGIARVIAALIAAIFTSP